MPSWESAASSRSSTRTAPTRRPVGVDDRQRQEVVRLDDLGGVAALGLLATATSTSLVMIASIGVVGGGDRDLAQRDDADELVAVGDVAVLRDLDGVRRRRAASPARRARAPIARSARSWASRSVRPPTATSATASGCRAGRRRRDRRGPGRAAPGCRGGSGSPPACSSAGTRASARCGRARSWKGRWRRPRGCALRSMRAAERSSVAHSRRRPCWTLRRDRSRPTSAARTFFKASRRASSPLGNAASTSERSATGNVPRAGCSGSAAIGVDMAAP